MDLSAGPLLPNHYYKKSPLLTIRLLPTWPFQKDAAACGLFTKNWKFFHLNYSSKSNNSKPCTNLAKICSRKFLTITFRDPLINTILDLPPPKITFQWSGLIQLKRNPSLNISAQKFGQTYLFKSKMPHHWKFSSIYTGITS